MKRNRKSKSMIIVKVLLLLGVFLFGSACSVLGLNLYEKAKSGNAETMIVQAFSDESKLITDKIAIVNLDVGTLVKEENINYASKLLTDLSDNFLFTGLEDARQGFATGIYAGYLIIPATFSESVVSLNDTPIRAEITYAINDDLREDIKEEVIYDVVGLVEELNNKVSYMYVHSVMDEFHDAQDEADTIMANDLEEKESINAVQAEDLVALIPVTEMTEIEYDIEPVDISAYMTKNVELTGEVGTKYTEYLTASEVDHQELNEEATALMTEMGNMDTIIAGIDLMHDEEGNSIYAKGTEELDFLFTDHNTKLEEKETEFGTNIIQIYKDIQTYLAEYDRAELVYQTENEQKYLNTLTALQTLFEEYQGNYVLVSTSEIQQLRETASEQSQIISELSGQLVAAYSVEAVAEEEDESQGDIPEINTGEDIPGIPEDTTIELSELQVKMQTVLEENYYVFSGYLLDEDGNVMKDENGNNIELTSLLAKYNQNLDDEETRAKVLEEQVGNIERLDIADTTQIVNDSILTPIQDKVTSIVTAITDQYAIEKEQLSAYSEAVVNYNPLGYIDYEEIQTITEEMYTNGTEMSEAIAETDLQQMEYVAEVYEATRNDLNTLQENIVQAKEDSDKAVEDGLADLKDVKNTNSAENQMILYDFSEKLPYTKLGSLEYTQAYEFMINPVGFEETETEKSQEQNVQGDSVKSAKDSVNVQHNRKSDYENIIMMVCAMICVIIVGSTIKYHFHKKGETYEG